MRSFKKKYLEVVSKCQTTGVMKRAELKLAAFLAENNLAFQLMDILVPLCKSIFSGCKIAYQVASKRILFYS